MNRIQISRLLALLGLVAIIAFAACSGGGGGSNPPAANGTVAMFLKDGPTDADKIWVHITKVALLPFDADENTSDAVVVYESVDGEAINLLDYQDDPYLFFVNSLVPQGEYAKIRLWIDDIWAEGGSCSDVEIKLPSNHIDLNPRGGFSVEADSTLSIEIDVDLEKSIALHEAGNSNKCIFRPVIFVNIYDHPSVMPRCPQIISGTILSLDLNAEEMVTGFEMELVNGGVYKLPLAVSTDTALIFSGTGDFVTPNELQVGNAVKVRGKLNENGTLIANLVVMGDVAMVKGVALSAVDEASSVFQLQPDPDQVVTGTTPVFIAPQTLVLIDCDTAVDQYTIQAGMKALVIGKIDLEANQLRAVALLLQPEEVKGLLTAVTPVLGGSWLTVETNPEAPLLSEIKLFLPEGVMPRLKDDGAIPMDLLMDLVACANRSVEIRLDPEKSQRVTELSLIPDEISGFVKADASPTDNRLSLDDGTPDQTFEIDVYPFASILNSAGSLVPLETIKEGDSIISHGLQSCETGIDQLAFVLSVLSVQTD